MSDFELIENYLSGKLSAEEKKAFRNRLLNDSGFNQEFQEIKNIRLFIRQNARKDLKNFFKEIEASIEKEKTGKDQTVMKKILIIAASVVLIVAISYLGLSNRAQSNQELYEKYYTAYNNLAGQVRREINENPSFQEQAMMAYDAGDFYKSAEMLSQLVIEQPNVVNYFYLGLSQMEIGEEGEAIKNLNTVVNYYDAFKEQARWYLALAHLNNEDKDAALGNIAFMLVNKSEYKERAEKLLNDMGLFYNEEGLYNGVILQSSIRPKEKDSPDGSEVMIDTRGYRKFQWGVVVSMDGEKEYRFQTDQPIEDLAEGDLALYVVFERSRGRGSSKMGWAFIVDKL